MNTNAKIMLLAGVLALIALGVIFYSITEMSKKPAFTTESSHMDSVIFSDDTTLINHSRIPDSVETAD